MLASALLGWCAIAAGAAPAPPAVAVLYFDYEGKNEELAILRKGLAQMLISDLAGGDRFTVVERARLESVIAELDLGRGAKFDPAARAKVGKLLGARYLVLGSYFDVGGSLRVDARVVEVETGKVLRSVGAAAAPDGFLEIEQKIAGEIQAHLEKALGAAAAREAPRGPPRSPRASQKQKKLAVSTAIKLSKALDAVDHKDPERAKREIAAARQEQPDISLEALDLAALVQ